MRILVTLCFISLPLFTHAAEIPLSVPSDLKGTYAVIEKAGSKNNPTLLTKRTGPSGISYAKRVFDCSKGTTKYIGTGDTIEELKQSKPEPEMYPLVEQSIAWYQARYACNTKS